MPWTTSWRRLHAIVEGDRVKTEDAEAVARHDGWVYVFGSQFGKKDGPLQPKRSFVARFREAEVRHVLEPPAAPLAVARPPFLLHRLVNDALRDGAMAGVRDLTLHGRELHVVTGNIDAREKGSVLLQDYPEGAHTMATHWRCRLPARRRSGELAAEQVREFPDLSAIEGIAIDHQGRIFYVSDEDEGVVVKHAHLMVSEAG
jgi:hypothetical protein